MSRPINRSRLWISILVVAIFFDLTLVSGTPSIPHQFSRPNPIRHPVYKKKVPPQHIRFHGHSHLKFTQHYARGAEDSTTSTLQKSTSALNEMPTVTSVDENSIVSSGARNPGMLVGLDDVDPAAPFAMVFPVMVMGETATAKHALTAGDAANTQDTTPSPTTAELDPGVERSPPASSTAGSPTESSANGIPFHRKKTPYTAPLKKLAIVVGLVAGLGFFLLLVMVLAEANVLNRNHPEMMHECTNEDEDEKDGSGANTNRKESEKYVGLGIAPFLKFSLPSANPVVDRQAGSTLRGGHHGRKHGTGELRSKFSVTSSDYPYSYYSSTYPSTSSTSTSSPVISTSPLSSSSSSFGNTTPTRIPQPPQHLPLTGHHPVPIFVVEDSLSPAQLLSPAEVFPALSVPDSDRQPRMITGMTQTSAPGRLGYRPQPSLSTISEEVSQSRSTLNSSPIYGDNRMGTR